MTREILKQTIKSAAKTTREAGTDALKAATEEATSVASSATKSLRAEAEARAEEGKAQLSQQGMKLNDVLRNRAENADYEIERRVLNVVAGSVAELSEDLRSRSISSIIDETERFARTHPGAFVAGAAIAGFALARFARASGRGHAHPSPMPVETSEALAFSMAPGTQSIGDQSGGLEKETR
ncbi:hypothetical protein QKW60_03985 [Defluviimonas aestuarii]|uniref:hypothetical protein n=1 Tax=Albidovulum aestuarii TaxID=1130726 RepID=UPI00249B91F5|nr:hypothetical protein [Defluviimonas aestuarii]MDI3335556.1 hypothetical protein [Defluviimonas aestuarii]